MQKKTNFKFFLVETLRKTGEKPKRQKKGKNRLKSRKRVRKNKRNKIWRERPERDTWRMAESAPSGADRCEAPEGALVN